MGCFGGGGGQTKQEKKLTTAQTGLVNQETNAAKFGLNTAENVLPQAVNTIEEPANFFRTLLHGNTGAIAAVEAPNIENINQQYETARKANDEFAPRGGGATAANEESRFSQARDISNLFSQARAAGASGLSGIGQLLASVGLGAMGGGTAAASAGGNVASQAMSALQTQQANQQQQQAAMGSAVGSMLLLLAGL